MKNLTNDLFYLEDKVDIITSCQILPEVNIPVERSTASTASPSSWEREREREREREKDYDSLKFWNGENNTHIGERDREREGLWFFKILKWREQFSHWFNINFTFCKTSADVCNIKFVDRKLRFNYLFFFILSHYILHIF